MRNAANFKLIDLLIVDAQLIIMNRILLLLLILTPSFVFGQLDRERELHKQILINLKKDLKENYYDPNLRGIDIDASIKEARDLVSSAKSVEEMTDIVA